MRYTTINKDLLIAKIQESVLGLCQENKCYHGDLAIDGIICITEISSNENVVAKIHSTLLNQDSNDEMSDVNSSVVDDTITDVTKNNPEVTSPCSENEPTVCMWTVDEYSMLLKPTAVTKHFSNAYNSVTTDVCKTKNKKRKANCLSGFSRSKEVPTIIPETEESELVSISKSKELLVPPIDSCQNMENNVGVPENMEANATSSGHTHEHNRYLCSIDGCSKFFSNSAEYSQHKAKVHCIYDCAQSDCERSFYTLEDIQNHIETCHMDINNARTPICRFCGKEYRRKDILEVHVANHFTHSPMKCDICSKRFYDKAVLTKHLKRVHGINIGRVIFCKHCLTGFETDECYRTHMDGETKTVCKYMKGMKELECHWCDTVERNAILMSKHVIRQHWQKLHSPLKCAVEDKT